MQINHDLYIRQFMIMKDVLIHYNCYRLIHDNLERMDKKLFWTPTINAHLKESVVSWCKVFGARSNETHWRKVFQMDKDAGVVLNGMLSEVGMTVNQWKVHHEKMTDFRNMYVAHNEKAYNDPVPFMEKSIKMCVAFDNQIIHELEKHNIHVTDDILNYVLEGYQEAIEIVKRNIVY